MRCTKVREGGPFFAEGAETQCGCERTQGWRESLMTGREAAVAAICGVVGGAAGGQTDGWLGAIVGVFVCGCLGAIGAMMMPEERERTAPARNEAARDRLRRAVAQEEGGAAEQELQAELTSA